MFAFVVRSLIVFVVVAVLCMLPLHVLLLLTDYHLVDTERLYALAYISLYMFAINSLFNAVVVGVLSHQYRRQVLVLLGVDRCRRSHHRPSLLSDWTGNRTRLTYDDHATLTSPSSFNSHSTRL